MKTSSVLLTVEAILLGGPTTAAVVYGLPVLMAFGIGTVFQSPGVGLFGLLELCGVVWALVEYWRLAARTAGSFSYNLGPSFWFGVAGAALGTFAFVGSIPPVAIALFVVPPAAGAAHFVYLQRRKARGQHAA